MKTWVKVLVAVALVAACLALGEYALHLWQTHAVSWLLYLVYAVQLLLLIGFGVLLLCNERRLFATNRYLRIRMLLLSLLCLFLALSMAARQVYNSIVRYYVVALGEIPPEPMHSWMDTASWLCFLFRGLLLVGTIFFWIARIKENKQEEST